LEQVERPAVFMEWQAEMVEIQLLILLPVRVAPVGAEALITPQAPKEREEQALLLHQ
jgi:hypothetical protein